MRVKWIQGGVFYYNFCNKNEFYLKINCFCRKSVYLCAMIKEYSKRLKNTSKSINTDTGEVIEIEKTFNVKVESAEFYFTFIEAVSFIHNIKAEFPVLAILCINSEFNTGQCLLTSYRRIEFAKQLNLTVKGFNSAIYRLAKKGAIINNGGTIEINPLYLWKGSVMQRNKILKEQGLELSIKFKSE